jgi:siroheme synthase
MIGKSFKKIVIKKRFYVRKKDRGHLKQPEKIKGINLYRKTAHHQRVFALKSDAPFQRMRFVASQSL